MLMDLAVNYSDLRIRQKASNITKTGKLENKDGEN